MDREANPWIFSTAEMLLGVSAISVVLGVGLAFGMLIGSWVALVIGLFVLIRSQASGGKREKKLGCLVSAPPIAAGAILTLLWGGCGIVPMLSPVGRPSDVLRMAELGDVSSYGIGVTGLGGFLDHQYVWRMAIAPDRLPAIVKEYELLPVEANDVPSSFWSVFPWRHRPPKRQTNRYFGSAEFGGNSRGQDGLHFFLMYDPQSQYLYVWHKDNF